jgi:hypothetical protein
LFRAKTPAQQCPICGTRFHLEAVRCTQCGATLTGAPEYRVESTQPIRVPGAKLDLTLDAPTNARWDQGEADLYEGMLPASPSQLLLVGAVLIAVLLGVGAFLLLQSGTLTQLTNPPTQLALADGSTLTPTPRRVRSVPTNTKAPPPVALIPTINLPTVTPAPPTATITPTRGPCLQTAQQGDTLYGMAARCGHVHLEVIDIILRLNSMTSANQLQIGQELQIPWPTPTGDAAAQGGAVATEVGAVPGLAEPTLLPGLRWYTVKIGETALSIVFDLNITMKILQDLNPEVRFEQCDYSTAAGGPNCSVLIFEGQRLRVPAPLPTATVPPTLTGSETPLPLPSPTQNVPVGLAPDDRMLFESVDVPTLRWLATGTLSGAEVFLVIVVDQTSGVTYTATTRDFSFQLPLDWQPKDDRVHTFQWRIAIASVGSSQTPVPTAYSTESRTFTWRGK